MSDRPCAAVTRGLTPLGLEVSSYLKESYAVNVLDAYDSEKRRIVIEEGFSYGFIKSTSERDLSHTLQSSLMQFCNIELLVNIVDPNELLEIISSESMSHNLVRAKVEEYLEGIISITKVFAHQMATQSDNFGYKGQIINVLNASSNTLFTNMLNEAIRQITKPLAQKLKPLKLRINTITVDSVSEYEELSSLTVVPMRTDLMSALLSVIENDQVKSKNIYLYRTDPRL